MASILESRKLVNPIRRLKDGELKTYLLLIKTPNSDETFWEIITGREEVYNFIKNNIDLIEVDESFVIANNTAINLDYIKGDSDKDPVASVYQFIKFVKEKNDIIDDFDIDDYIINRDIDNESGSDIGVGLESAGVSFTGVAGSYYSDSEDD